MTWSSGFGDELDVEERFRWEYRKRHGWIAVEFTPDQLLSRYRRWLFAVAYGLGATSENVDDVAQEGYVAMWRALKTHDPLLGKQSTWITNAARMRMKNVLYGRGQPLGKPESRGVREVKPTDSLDALLDSGAEIADLSCDLLDRVLDSYHHGALVAAINSLPPLQRRYVVLRFWAGMDTAGIAHSLELNEVATARLWNGGGAELGARRRLASSLLS